jgi:hypothetical protein
LHQVRHDSVLLTIVAEAETLGIDNVDDGRAEPHARGHDTVKVLVQGDGLRQGRHHHGHCDDVAMPCRLVVVLSWWLRKMVLFERGV